MKLTENAEKVLEKRYYQRSADGDIIETWPNLVERVAAYIAGVEAEPKKWAPMFYNLMLDCTFLPNSPVLKNAGANKGTLSACFVLPVDDDLSEIFDTLRKASLVQKFGGGTGFSFSRLRPEGDLIAKTGGISSGPISFMRVFDFSLGDIIKQGGTRPGANMGVLRIDHPDIFKFIEAKKDGLLKNFNISVGVTDRFMYCLKNGTSFDLRFNGKKYDTIDPLLLWDKIIQMAWKDGDPGVLFLDTINKNYPLKDLEAIEATNPCGEQPLRPYESCTLGSINLGKFAVGDWTESPAKLNTQALRDTVNLAVRFLDDVVDMNHFPIAELGEKAGQTRQIGLGVMGFADLCIKMHIRYGSEDSVELAKTVMKTIYDQAKEASEALADEKGVFPALDQLDEWEGPARRNSLLTSCAPTGTLSLIADCSGGVEPHFALNFGKNCLGNEQLSIMPSVVGEWLEKHGRQEPLPEFFVTAHDVSPLEHLIIQATFQNNGVDSGVSKTVNLPNDATPQMVDEIYRWAWEMGCKGTTVYRDGSKSVQALEQDGVSECLHLQRGELKKRTRGTTGPNIGMQTACGKLYVSPFFDRNGLFEIFMRSKNGGCEANMEAVGTLASYLIRSGVDPKRIVKRLRAIKCPACLKSISKGNGVDVQSCPAGVGTAIAIALENKQAYMEAAGAVENIECFFLNRKDHRPEQVSSKGICPDCQQPSLRPEAGCVICSTEGCGYSRC